MSTSRHTYTYDDLLCLHEWGTALTASDHGSDADDTAIIRDLGTGLFEADMIIDVSELDVADGDEIVTVGFQISSSATFASSIWEVASLKLGDAAVLPGDTDMTTGRYILPVRNEIASGVRKRYGRVYFTIAGTVGGFLALVYLGKRR
jgi:hypothetical protein